LALRKSFSANDLIFQTVEDGLGADFTPEVKEAWTTVYGLLADTMKDAAVQAAA